MAADAINAFGLDLYRLMAGDGDRNLVFSPASIALALGMARAGARGETAAEMDAVMHGAAADDLPNGLGSLDHALAERNGTFGDAYGEEADVALRIANTTFAQHGFGLEQAYLDALAARSGSGVQLVDFIADPEAARRLINGWVADETQGRIPELIAPGVIDELTRLALVNAIYLKAQWHLPFEDHATTDGPFTTAGGSSVTVPMMRGIEPFSYASGERWQAVELPYVGEALAMTIIVPDDLGALERRLDAEFLEAVVDDLETAQVELAMPRFGIESQASLRDLLSELGMPLAFDPQQADFSSITSDAQLYISHVIHQANIHVDEDGTEAAAATAVIARLESSPGIDVTLVVDRPFLFALRDTLSGAVLFLGRVTDPSNGG